LDAAIIHRISLARGNIVGKIADDQVYQQYLIEMLSTFTFKQGFQIKQLLCSILDLYINGIRIADATRVL